MEGNVKMCNLNIIIKNKVGVFTNKSMPSFLMGVTKKSYNINDDGDGIFLSSHNILIKGKRKVNLYKYESQIKESNFIITHQRIATSGMSVKYTQPFSNKDFILAHNGIISELVKGDKSDTHLLFKNFYKVFNKSKGNRNKRIIKAIKESVEDISFGSYSIVIYDKKTENLYYFKNNGTWIHFFRNKNIIFITTSFDNDVFLNMLNQDFDEMEIDDDTIYRISIKDKIKIRKVGKIKYKISSYYGQRDEEDDDGEEFYGEQTNNIHNFYNQENKGIETIDSTGACCECGNLALNMFVNTYEHICDACLGWWGENQKRRDQGRDGIY